MERAAISERLRQAWKRKGMTEQQIATALGVGKSTVSNWLTGRTQPPFETFAILCQMLEVSADQILAIPGAKPPNPETYLKIRLRCPRCGQVIERLTDLGDVQGR